MVKEFLKAMLRWALSRFAAVSIKEYFQRRVLCSDCTTKRTCPKCGCFLWLKARMATEKCPEGKWKKKGK